jgi:hypothetical protein
MCRSVRPNPPRSVSPIEPQPDAPVPRTDLPIGAARRGFALRQHVVVAPTSIFIQTTGSSSAGLPG